MIHWILFSRKSALTAFALCGVALPIIAQTATSESPNSSSVPASVPSAVNNPSTTNPPSEMVIELDHKVKKGETLYAIAKHYHCTVAELQSLNPGIGILKPGMKVRVKQRTKVPVKSTPVAAPQLNPIAARNKEIAIATLPEVPENVTDHVVTKGQSLYSISKQYGVSIGEIKKINNLTSDQLSINQKLWIPNKQAASANVADIVANKPATTSTANSAGVDSASTSAVVATSAGNASAGVAQAMPNATGVSIKDSMNNQGGMPEQVVTKLKTSNLKEYEKKVTAQIGYEGMKADRSWVMINKHKKGEVVAVINPVNKKMVYCTVIGELPDKGNKHIAVSQSVADRLGITEANATLRVRYVAQ